MNNIEKTIEITELYDYYKELLTEKQKHYFELYFFEDLTFQEIGEEAGVSRAAIHDSISKTVNTLEDIETKLKLKVKADFIKDKIGEYKQAKIDVNTLISSIEGEF
ncbi:YlxM family DNA-binding protein [Spiroplasma culicicola]|uniref:UPF0122 protein SCULI_v1c08250 n=1 Tax=Spiroplasma culicicola AES-1 TaxID=1276246 RepID=W6A8E9_9MOLU|nr:sigma factor-like helix-turn-helix DNA-binding protein [Spiroplasma culicicola]AHI53165.1 hypothetical protein SCULI_v1c08250 [Spiroplasma culicicola AES-1]